MHGLAPAGVPAPGLNFGTDMAGIFNLIGSTYSLVTLDGRAVKCTGLIGIWSRMTEWGAGTAGAPLIPSDAGLGAGIVELLPDPLEGD